MTVMSNYKIEIVFSQSTEGAAIETSIIRTYPNNLTYYLEVAAKASYAKALVSIGDKSFELRRLSVKLKATPQLNGSPWLPVELWKQLKETCTDDPEFSELFAWSQQP